MEVWPAVNAVNEGQPARGWPVVLAAPHGGDQAPAWVPDRTSGCLEPDWHSLELARECRAAFCRIMAGGSDGGIEAGSGDRNFRSDYGLMPALVGMRLHRQKLDANRARRSAAEPVVTAVGGGIAAGTTADAAPSVKRTGTPTGAPAGDDVGGEATALGAWEAYHRSLEASVKACVEAHGYCLVLDVHGQSHRRGVSELGYLVTSSELLLSDADLDARARGGRLTTSLDALFRRQLGTPTGVHGATRGAGDGASAREADDLADAARDRASMAAMVRGPFSLGGLLAARGYHATPSPSIPEPCSAVQLAAAAAAAAAGAALVVACCAPVPAPAAATLCAPCAPGPYPASWAATPAVAASTTPATTTTTTTGPPAPGVHAAATYFWGAYTVRRFGAPKTVPADCNPILYPSCPPAPRDPHYSPDDATSHGPPAFWADRVAAVQLETAWEGARDTAESRQAFAAALASATAAFLAHWGGVRPTSDEGLV